jgi:hypothetical protein
MTKGTKNYFRHLFNASDDPGISQIIAKYGVVGYGYYFLLVELLSGIEAVEKNDGNYKIHIRTICKKLSLRRDGCVNYLDFLTTCLTLSYHLCEDVVHLAYPNIPKYMGSYNGFKEINETIKEKKIKEKKRVEQPESDLALVTDDNAEAHKWIIDFLPDDTLELLKAKKVSIKTQKAWLNKYSKKHLEAEISKAAIWELDNRRVNFGGFLSGWLGRNPDIWREAEIAKKEQEEYQTKFIEDCMRFDDDKKTSNK